MLEIRKKNVSTHYTDFNLPAGNLSVTDFFLKYIASYHIYYSELSPAYNSLLPTAAYEFNLLRRPFSL